MKIVLASSSPRRFELLKGIYSDFTVIKPQCDEKNYPTPSKTVKNLALTKALAVDTDFDVLISADTIVVHKGKIIGKPKSPKNAIEILTNLRGKNHKVYTGVCIRYKDGKKCKTDVFYAVSTVKMKNLTDNEIRDYVKTGSPCDKAGAYGIPDGVVECYKGSYSNIVGLPVEDLIKRLKRHRLL